MNVVKTQTDVIRTVTTTLVHTRVAATVAIDSIPMDMGVMVSD